MKPLILSQSEIRRLLPMTECIDAMAETLTALERGEAANPLRQVVLLPERRGLLGLMPGYVQSPPALGLKATALLHSEHTAKLDSHQGIAALFDADTGQTLASRGRGRARGSP